jgi:outer membrane receptor for ferrienterochelin and colicins
MRRQPLQFPITFILLCAILAAGIVPAISAQPNTGTIAGRLTGASGAALGNVSVIIDQLSRATLTDSQGRFRFDAVPAGTYSVTFTSGDRTEVQEGVEVRAAETSQLDKSVEWQVLFAETLVVTSASRRPERIVDAPAAVTVLTAQEIQAEVQTGQVPKLLEFTPGVEVTQGGLYDFNINTRGFNSSLNRRVAVLIDGRDPSVPFLASQEWTATSLPIDDIESLEMVRGPSAALYGANASSGVINMVTKAPRGSEGGLVRLTGGELSTTNADLRWAGGLGGEWYYKVLGGYRESETFTQSRTAQPEYSQFCATGQSQECLPREAAAPVGDSVEGWAGTLRLDKYFGESMVLTLEGGSASFEGGVAQTNIGRVQVNDVERPYLRLNLNHPRWNVILNRTQRDAPEQLALSSGLNVALDDTRNSIEAQTNFEWADDFRLVIGGAWDEEEIDSFDPRRGTQTLVFGPKEDETVAAFAQLDWRIADNLKLVLAGRYDDSDIFYQDEFSPKAALVWGVTPAHSLRLTYNEGFQAGNYSEKFLRADVAAPLPLQPLEGLFCTPFGVSCGFDRGVRVLAVGNENLGVESVKAIELGYSGILANKLFLTVDLYDTQNEDFISDLVSTQFTPLGDFNTEFGSYQAPAGLPGPVAAQLIGTLQALLGPQYLLMSNNDDGSPILAAVSYATFGQVDTTGVDVSVNYYLNPTWTLSANYSWFDFEIEQDVAGLERILSPNWPESSVRAQVAYHGDRLTGSVAGRWAETFFWATGPFNGDVDSYTVFDLSAGYRITDRIQLGANVSNLFDDKHIETFGGDIIERRALGSVTFSW